MGTGKKEDTHDTGEQGKGESEKGPESNGTSTSKKCAEPDFHFA